MVETWWRVADTGEGELRPLSIMAHLVDGDGRAVAVADGLGVPIEGWEAGDVIVQFHEFSVETELEGESYWLQTGVYWLDTLERQEVTGPGQETGDRILLEEIRLADDS